MRLEKIPGMMRFSHGLPWLCGVHVRCTDTARLPEPLLLDGGGRKPDGEGGPVILGRGRGVDVDAAAMGLDDGQGDRHAQPR